MAERVGREYGSGRRPRNISLRAAHIPMPKNEEEREALKFVQAFVEALNRAAKSEGRIIPVTDKVLSALVCFAAQNFNLHQRQPKLYSQGRNNCRAFVIAYGKRQFMATIGGRESPPERRVALATHPLREQLKKMAVLCFRVLITPTTKQRK